MIWIHKYQGVIKGSLGIMIIAVFAACWFWPRLGMPRSTPISPTAGSARSSGAATLNAKIATAAESGDWSTVTTLIDDVRQHRRKGRDYATVDKEVSIPIRVECESHFLPLAGQGSKRAGKLRLARGDEYWLHLTISAECYLYVIEQSSSGQLSILFPNPQNSTLKNPASADARLPEDYSKTFKVSDAVPGTYAIYVLAARWRQKRLEDLIEQGTQANSDKILGMIELAEHSTQNIAGMSVGRYTFTYEPSVLISESK